jgi:hypothetical protein
VRTNQDPRLTRYLLGELSESEQASLEREFFEDPAVFERLVAEETELVDAYVRHRLPPRLEERFERHYLAHPDRRSRVEFAVAFAKKLDEIDDSSSTRTSDRGQPLWVDLRSFWRGRNQTLNVAVAAVMLLLVLAAGWLAFNVVQLRRDLAETQVARQVGEQREQELQRQLSRERTRGTELINELERLRNPSPPAPTNPAGPRPAAPIVSLLLTVRGARGPDTAPPPTLVVAPGTSQVSVQLAMEESDYSQYQLALAPVGGAAIVVRRHVKPQTTASGVRVVLTVPADRLAAGDYMLTLSGERPVGAPDDLSKSLFRVERK